MNMLASFLVVVVLCWTSTEAHEIIAIGDLHGDFTNAVRVMKLAGLIGEDLHWIGGDRTLIQMGDMADRGPHTHTLIEYFERLKVEAAAEGGEVITLLGNHEVMNMHGEVTFVAPGEMASFGGKAKFLDAYKPTGPYGSILVTHDCVVIRNGTVFVHAGLLPQFASRGVDKLNNDMREVIKSGRWSDDMVMNDGPVWTRELIQRYDTSGDCSLLDETLQILSAAEVSQGRPPVTRMVVGHTIQAGGKMMDRCKGRLVAIDICISAYYVGCGYIGFLRLRKDETGAIRHEALYPSAANYGKHPLNDTVGLPTLIKHDPEGYIHVVSGDSYKATQKPHAEPRAPSHKPKRTSRPRPPLYRTDSAPYELILIVLLVIAWRLRHIYIQRNYRHKKNDAPSASSATL
eukprot:PhF_6_TR12878/c0_g1_i1/m.20252